MHLEMGVCLVSTGRVEVEAAAGGNPCNPPKKVAGTLSSANNFELAVA